MPQIHSVPNEMGNISHLHYGSIDESDRPGPGFDLRCHPGQNLNVPRSPRVDI